MTTPSYPKRELIAVIVSMPVAFGLNFSMNPVESLVSEWMIVVINAIVISSYMVFVIPKAIMLASRLTVKEVK